MRGGHPEWCSPFSKEKRKLEWKEDLFEGILGGKSGRGELRRGKQRKEGKEDRIMNNKSRRKSPESRGLGDRAAIDPHQGCGEARTTSAWLQTWHSQKPQPGNLSPFPT